MLSLFRFCPLVLVCLVAGAAPLPAPAATASVPTARYWVYLRDKAGMHFEPAQYFSAPARARRLRQHLPAADSTDFPVRPDYVRGVEQASDSVLFVSRWFNAVCCRATPAQVRALRGLPGVMRVEAQTPLVLLPTAKYPAVRMSSPEPLTAAERYLARQQTASLGGQAFQKARLDGHGLRIAIFDVGFNGTDKHPAFQHLFRDKRVVATHDFVRNRESVYGGGSHGTEVLSCIAGRLPDGTPLGLAPQAEFLLARTERMLREVYVEEQDWLAAAEWADRNGADIINSSLGYTNRRYFPEQMNGRSSLVARAAGMAVRKGILVVNAAGNDGDDAEWRTIGTPADGDSVLAVGGIDPDTYLHIEFSSYGPTADRRLKPNVVAFGTVLAATPRGYEQVQGTSFASPLMAGFAACAWQQNRQLTVRQLFEQLQQAGGLYPYFDYAHGYGLPRASVFMSPHQAKIPPQVDFSKKDSLLSVIIRPEAAFLPGFPLPMFTDSVAALTPGEALKAPKLGREAIVGPAPVEAAAAPLPRPTDYLYWHVASAEGVLRRYEVREVRQRVVVQIPLRTLQSGDLVRVWFRGSMLSYLVP
ncbi:S8 family serine peptidase [Hymenobacter sp. BT175]|uniref:S8 family serine peptidase n=1 Tax=Hymenobacter translucens TaxID=2886507 RepID=UPI001D0EDF48|nr:S8 family serine peptidase [Hymenobacter translucens]MCC2544996.1 S8 family serine peptidase [Hymenobacter translucens]